MKIAVQGSGIYGQIEKVVTMEVKEVKELNKILADEYGIKQIAIKEQHR